MYFSLVSMQTSFLWLLCSLSLITFTHAKKCAGGAPGQLASQFKGYKPASTYCASKHAVASVTINKNFPATTVTSFNVVSVVTVYNATTTITVPGDVGMVITTTTTTTSAAVDTPSAIKRRGYIVEERDHIIQKRDYVQDQVFSSLQQNPDMVASMCDCLGATATITKSMTATHTLTVPTTATSYAVQTKTVTSLCLNTDTANYLINGFASLLTAYDNDVAEALLADDFADTSDSINQLAGYNPGSVTFPSKIAFEYGQGTQPAIGFQVLHVDTITCNALSFRWEAFIYGDPVKGINVMYASNLNNTAEGWQIETNYSEFNSWLWAAEVGLNCGFVAPAQSNSSTTSTTTTTTTDN